MPNTRTLLWLALAAIVFYNYQAWIHDYPPPGTHDIAIHTTGNAPGAAATLGDSVPQAASTAALPATPAAPASAAAGRQKPRARRRPPHPPRAPPLRGLLPQHPRARIRSQRLRQALRP